MVIKNILNNIFGLISANKKPVLKNLSLLFLSNVEKIKKTTIL